MKKALAIGIIVQFLIVGFYPTSAIGTALESIIHLRNGNTLYVGGSGPGNYTKIQDAVDNASDGDTIFIFNGQYEGFIARKTLNIIGESRSDTIVISDKRIQRIRLMADWTNLSNLRIIGNYVSTGDPALQTEGNYVTVSNCDIVGGKYGYAGIEVGGSYSKCNYYRSNIRIINCDIKNFEYRGITLACSYNCYIENCRIYDNDYRGIEMHSTTYHNAGYYYIYNCEFFNNYIGIELGRRKNFIGNCKFYDNYCGIYNYHIEEWTRDQIIGCYFTNNTYGCIFDPYGGYYTKDDKILGNVFENNNRNIYFTQWCRDNEIYHNNFLNCSEYHAADFGVNNWDNGSEGNYWDDYTGSDNDGDGIGDTPYYIPVGNGKDDYPLMNPVSMENICPEKPVLDGPSEGYQWVEYDFSAETNDSNYDFILYKFDWGDGTDSGWVGPFGNWEEGKTFHIWKEHGTFDVKVKAKDLKGAESEWSDILTINIEPNYYPLKPEVIGPSEGIAGHWINFSVKSIDLDNDQIRYFFDSGEETTMWTSYSDSGETVIIKYKWGNSCIDIGEKKILTFKIKAQDIHGAFSPWYIQDITIINNPPEKPTITGPTLVEKNKEIIFGFKSWDTDDHRFHFNYEIYHQQGGEWIEEKGGGTSTVYSNETLDFSYSFDGYYRNYMIGIYAHDEYDAEGPWAYHNITVKSRSRMINEPILRLFDKGLNRFLSIFPNLQKILFYLIK